jgi:hypothetical protein
MCLALLEATVSRMIVFLSLFALAACGEADTGNADPPVIGTDTSDTGALAPVDTTWEPVAVGFELVSNMGAYNELEQIPDATYGPIDPFMVLTFARLEYFSAGADPDTDTCYAVADFAVAPDVKPDQIPVDDGAVLFASYETNLTITGHTCAGVVNVDSWGEDAMGLIGAFDGMHLGYGMGPMTDYLLTDQDGEPRFSDDDLDLFGEALMGTYVAMNNTETGFLGEDWTITTVWETDENGEALSDAAGLLENSMPITDIGATGDVPEGYVLSWAYWYQDFPLFDINDL